MVSVTAGASTSAIFRQESPGQMLGHGGAEGINFGTGNLLNVNNPDLFDSLSDTGLHKAIATAHLFNQVFRL